MPLSTGAKDSIAGGIGGLAMVVSGHPLDTVKVRLQAQGQGKVLYNGLIDCAAKTVAREGVKGLFVGMISPLVAQVPNMTVTMAVRGMTLKTLAANYSDGRPRLSDHVFCGVATASTATFVECPLEVIKCKMQSRVLLLQRGASHVPPYSNSFECARYVWTTSGPAGYYQGFSASLLRNVPGKMGYFGTYEAAKRLMTTGSIAQPDPTETLQAYSTGVLLVAGGLAGVAYWTFGYIGDVAKTRMQADHSVRSQRKYKSLVHCIAVTAREEGVLAFTKGYTACILRSFPANAIALTTYEFMLSLMQNS